MSRSVPVLAVALVVLSMLLPLLWTVVASLDPKVGPEGGKALLPGELRLTHYRALFAARDFWLPLRNSLVVAATTTLFCVALGSLSAYALVRLEFRFKKLLLGSMLAVTMFPQISIVSPLFLLLRTLGLIDTFPGLVLPYMTFAMPLSVWLLVSYLRQLPVELEHAALVDGASRLRTLWEIVLPLSLPGLAATAILTFVYCWNEFLFAFSFTTSPQRQTVPVAVALFKGHYEMPWGEVLAAAVVATLPVALVILVFQRRIVQGLTSGAVKG